MRGAWILCLAGTACALDAGAPLATVADGTLTARLVLPSARALGDHTLLGRDGERIELSTLALTVGEVVLSSGASGAGAFDPAAPPPGFSTCHSGHCHADDGRLVPYADVQREAAGGSGLAVALAMPVEASADLLQASPLPLASFEPGRDLPRVTVVRGEVVVEHLTLTARISGGARELDLRVDLDLDQRWATALDLEIADAAPVVAPRVELVLDGLFLDALDTQTTTTTTLVLDRPDAPGADALIRALASTQPVISLADVTSEEP